MTLPALKELIRLLPDALGMEWRDILGSSKLLQELAMSPEAQEIYNLATSLRERLVTVMVNNSIITAEEASAMGVVPLVQRFKTYLEAQSQKQHKPGARRPS